ncbi:MAG TPA: hypothetical protein VIY48_13945 [Candidatus Paceibacterota bacterium]
MTVRMLALLALTLISVNIHASSLTLQENTANLDPSIQSVSLCGNWHYQNENGSFRVIYGWLWGHTEIYVQWLADPNWYPEKGQERREVPRVLNTLAFPEYDHYEAATDLTDIRCLKRNGRWAIVANADNANDDEQSGKYELVIYLYDTPGKFKLVKHPIRQSK